MKIVLLISGGLDSTTLLAHALSLGIEVNGLFIDYNSMHNAKEWITMLQLQEIYDFNLRYGEVNSGVLNQSALTNPTIEMSATTSVLPMRNTVLLGLATAYAIECEAKEVWFGANAADQRDYPDCRPIFIGAMQNLIDCQFDEIYKAPVIKAPLIDLTKSDIIAMAQSLKVDFAKTWTCYRPVGQTVHQAKPCGTCPACVCRAEAFAQAGIVDPLVTQSQL